MVDGDKSVLRVFSRILQKSGYAVETAETGKESIEKVQNNQYDVVLIDLELPNIDRNDLLRKMHEEIPITAKILVACFPYWENGIQAINFRSDDCLLKPLKPEFLLTAVAEKLNHTEKLSK